MNLNIAGDAGKKLRLELIVSMIGCIVMGVLLISFCLMWDPRYAHLLGNKAKLATEYSEKGTSLLFLIISIQGLFDCFVGVWIWHFWSRLHKLANDQNSEHRLD